MRPGRISTERVFDERYDYLGNLDYARYDVRSDSYDAEMVVGTDCRVASSRAVGCVCPSVE